MACCRLERDRPDLPRRNCDLDRRWDILHYLLSATRRGEPAAADRAIDQAFDGTWVVADHVRAGQGAPVRHLPPTAVAEVVAALEPMSEETLRARHHPAALQAASVYKFRADRADDAEWRWTADTFHALREFFRAAARTGDAVLTVRD